MLANYLMTFYIFKATPLTKPRPPSATSIPAILKALQDEWVRFNISIIIIWSYNSSSYSILFYLQTVEVLKNFLCSSFVHFAYEWATNIEFGWHSIVAFKDVKFYCLVYLFDLSTAGISNSMVFITFKTSEGVMTPF